MKLKKIASLMLAGIMAVSMLAGCATTSNEPEDPTDEPTVTPSSSNAQMMVDNMSKDAQNKVSAVANSDLTAALQSAVEDYFSNADVVKYGSLFEIEDAAYGVGRNDARDTDIGEALVSNLGAYDNEIANLDNIGPKTDSFTVVEVYGVNGSVPDKDLLEQIGHKIDSEIVALDTEDDRIDNKQENVKQYIDFDYEVSVSIVTANGRVWGIEDTVKFVAVAVTRTGEIVTSLSNPAVR